MYPKIEKMAERLAQLVKYLCRGEDRETLQEKDLGGLKKYFFGGYLEKSFPRRSTVIKSVDFISFPQLSFGFP